MTITPQVNSLYREKDTKVVCKSTYMQSQHDYTRGRESQRLHSNSSVTTNTHTHRKMHVRSIFDTYNASLSSSSHRRSSKRLSSRDNNKYNRSVTHIGHQHLTHTMVNRFRIHSPSRRLQRHFTIMFRYLKQYSKLWYAWCHDYSQYASQHPSENQSFSSLFQHIESLVSSSEPAECFLRTHNQYESIINDDHMDQSTLAMIQENMYTWMVAIEKSPFVSLKQLCRTQLNSQNIGVVMNIRRIYTGKNDCNSVHRKVVGDRHQDANDQDLPINSMSTDQSLAIAVPLSSTLSSTISPSSTISTSLSSTQSHKFSTLPPLFVNPIPLEEIHALKYSDCSENKMIDAIELWVSSLSSKDDDDDNDKDEYQKHDQTDHLDQGDSFFFQPKRLSMDDKDDMCLHGEMDEDLSESSFTHDEESYLLNRFCSCHKCNLLHSCMQESFLNDDIKHTSNVITSNGNHLHYMYNCDPD